MIINSAPQNEAVLSNVGEIGEFRIRNSAKAFNILSSGLYANKIKAIVRELSCNAVDSHAAAGKKDTPFDVHLPNHLEPHFSIRDYGTGLNHEQVTNIYTTYFESTKTASNEFIGALGLGSKSPFSYTDNFTVTAIKDGIKGIYTAFINEAGVPSIALMTSEETTEPAGVEVKFSVNDRWDFDKFRQEAHSVYRYFNLKPVVGGVDGFEIRVPEYEAENIIPGVHQYKNARRYDSVAIMGNIAYPIEIPKGNDDPLFALLNCGLEMHFAIGELDFQASREGLSYIPQTIESIKRKLNDLNAVLADKIAEEANQIRNMWDRAVFLKKRRDNTMWQAPVDKYVADTKFPLWHTDTQHGGYYNRPKTFKFPVELLAKKYNISIVAFNKGRGSSTTNAINPSREHVKTGAHYKTIGLWEIPVGEDIHFVKNDTKIGAAERAKYHWRNQKFEAPAVAPYNATVFVLSPADKTKTADYTKFLKHLCSPRQDRICNATDLMEKPRKDSGHVSAKNVTIMKLCERDSGGYYRSRDMVWRDAGKADTFDAKTTYYYVPLSGYNMLLEAEYGTAKSLYKDVTESGVMPEVDLYGVRKTDIEWVKLQKNWVNIEDHLKKILGKIGKLDSKITMSFVKSQLGSFTRLQYNSAIADSISNVDSPYLTLVNKFKDIPTSSYDKYHLDSLCKAFKVQSIDSTALVESLKQECEALYQRYPLFHSLRDGYGHTIDPVALAEYVNLIDASKGV